MEAKGTKKPRTRGVTPPAGQATQKGIPIQCPQCRTENLSDSRFCTNCATPLKESSDSGSRTIKAATFQISRGDLFAVRYEIIESLGQGGMGKVYKTYDRKISEVVALKLIRPEISVNEKAIERFKNELKIARRITHRNICRMHDIGEEGFYHYITMEYVAGEDLKRFIRRAGTLSSGKATHIAKQVCEGLAEAHRLGIIHRDLKPQNIMIDQDGNAKIMDFGIARFADMDRMTGSGVMIGTPEYMSPEQAELLDVDKRADIYSLGVVMYEMVTGRVPFDGETPLSIAMKHKTEKPKNVREINEQIPVALAAIIGKCMEKSPANRYQTAEELLEELGKIEKDVSTGERVVPAGKTSAPKEKPASKPKKKWLLPLSLTAAAGLILIAVLSFLPRKGKTVDPAGKSSEVAAIQGENMPVTTPTGVPKEEKAQPKQKTEAAVKQEAPPAKTETETTTPETKTEGKTAAAAPPAEKKPAVPANPDLDMANLGQARTFAFKSQVQKQNPDPASEFIRFADAKAQEGQNFIAQKNYIEARSVFAITERLYRFCLESKKDEDRLKGFKKFVKGLKKDASDELKPAKGDKLFAAAEEAEKKGLALADKKDVPGAMKSLYQAATFYQKALLSPVPEKKK